MPAANTTVTATYAAVQPSTYQLTVGNGSGRGSYAAGTVVTITANAAPSGQVFSSWFGESAAAKTHLDFRVGGRPEIILCCNVINDGQ
jgi:hypothetical protein